MAPISRREQLELDELLSDIYRGIETLPDNSKDPNVSSREFTIEDTLSGRRLGRAYVREYELDESSPLVQRHRQEIAEGGRLQKQQQQHQEQQPQRSTLKRQTQQRVGTPGQLESQSLASFVTSNPLSATRATPEHKRRVRIVDHREQPTQATGVKHNAAAPRRQIRAGDQDYLYDDDDDDEDGDEDDDYDADYPAEDTSYLGSPFDSRQKVSDSASKKQKVKYVNTNKLIYHQERDPLEENNDDDDDDDDEGVENRKPRELEGDEIADGVTRVEYYHTTWLDRQLGRASKRRSSKELTERQVKEKAMIEELKRSLKNGAITLKQSLRGKRNEASRGKPRADDLFVNEFDYSDNNRNNLASNNRARDDYFARQSKSNTQSKKHNKSIFSSGLATIPRNYQQAAGPKRYEQLESGDTYYRRAADARTTPEETRKVSGPHTAKQLVETKAAAATQAQEPGSMQQQYSRTLPSKRSQEHQLLQSHYRDGKQRHLFQQQQPQQAPLIDRSATLTHHQQQQPGSGVPAHRPQQQQQQHQQQLNMRNPQYNAQWCAAAQNTAVNERPQLQQELTRSSGTKSPLQQRASSDINRAPSATEVVRSALSRSGSQVSLNQLNKTISLLPDSPPPYGPSTTPTQQLRAASPTLSPSPVDCRHNQATPSLRTHLASGQVALHGTRTVGRPPQQHQQQQQRQQQTQAQQKQQPVYANPHASLMQHRQEQQSRQTGRNTASIREFNELDSLLKSLSASGGTYRTPSAQATRPAQVGAHGTPSTQITPGFSTGPAQATFGGFIPAQQQNQHQQPNSGDLYAQVRKPAASQASHTQTTAGGTPFTRTHQPYTIDVTNKKLESDENCRERMAKGNPSDFEPQMELLPSMEDYQNISKLNPVTNRFWYKPNMSREQAISLLKDKPQGTFIVRDSTSFRGAYGLAVKVTKLPKNVLENSHLRSYNDPSAEFIRHFLIEPAGDGVRLKGYANEPVFDNLADLIYQHSLTELALPCKLLIPRADIEDPRFNYKQKQFFDEFLASKEQAKHQPYERTSPNGGYRIYPGDVLVHNEHRIIFE